MRYSLVAGIVLMSITIATAKNPPDSAKSNPSFDKLKSLIGSWTGKDTDGNPVTISYKLVSAGTALMETLDMGADHEAMVTMYHMNGEKLMMTHYCSMGNQPRMRADRLSKDGNTISFSYLDATNLSNKDSDHMHKLFFTFKDDTHFSQEWTMHMAGKKEHVALFEFERTK